MPPQPELCSANRPRNHALRILILIAAVIPWSHPCLAQAKKRPPAAKRPMAKPVPTKKGTKTAPLATAAAGEDWGRFRGPGGQGSSAATGLPLEWSSDENIAWKQELPGPGASSPIVLGDYIYVTCYSGFFVPGEEGGTQEDLRRHLLCLDRASGKQLWERTVAPRLPEEERIRDHGFAASTPAADDEAVYCFFGKSGVHAFDHSGTPLWQADVGEGTNGWGSAASPVLYQDLLFVNASVESESLVALERASGKERWRVEGINESWNTPVVATSPEGRSELVVATQGKIRAFEPETGRPLWTCATDIGWYMVPSVVAQEGIVYCLGGRSGVASLAVRSGGAGDVTQTHRLWTSHKGSNVSSPVLQDGYLYWAQDNLEIAYCAEAASGKLVYEKRLNRAGSIYASALLADGRLYYMTRDGKTFVLSAKPEFEELAVNDLRDGSVFNGSIAIDGTRLLIRSDKALYAIGK
ncbi:MAG: PQQ-binding-like beta-propeller repeat protein [Planctomycetales bacterium]